MTLDPRSGGGEEISHAENIPGRVGRLCKGTNVRACLVVPVTAAASVDLTQRFGGECKGMRSGRLQESDHAGLP